MKLAIQGVGKTYNGKVQALRDFTLEMGPGVVGLLGPNGAGKSTLMRILATITSATRGTALWYIGPAQPTRELDFVGASPAAVASGIPLYYLAATAALLAAAVIGRRRQIRN